MGFCECRVRVYAIEQKRAKCGKLTKFKFHGKISQIGIYSEGAVQMYRPERKMPRCGILTEISLVVGVCTLEYIRYFTDGHKCGWVYGMYDGF